ncbi:MAG: CotH kinase family protein [Pseudomonadota bacterium]|nr:CotH kinase family protein [Pseudomonadota bacterium]
MILRMLLVLLACAPDPLDTGRDTDDTAGGDTDSRDTDSRDTDTEVIGDDSCDPGAPPVYGVEGEPLSFTIGCTGAGAAASFSAPSLPAGATFDAGTAVVSWTPGPADAGHYAMAVTSSGEGSDVGVVDVWVADGWEAADNVAVDPRTYLEEHGLPVMHLERPSTTNDTDDVEAVLVYRGKPYAVNLKYRGAASSYYPKRSYTVSFSAEDRFEDEAEGFDDRRKIVVTTLFDDNSYLRQLLCYELWSAMDDSDSPGGRHDIQTFLSVLYVNGEYEGIFLISDHIDGEYWEDHGYYEDGSLFKSVTHEGNFYDNYGGTPKSTWHDGYEKQEGQEDEWFELDVLVEFVATASDADFTAHIEEYVVIEEIADWWILVRYTEADDSGGKNAYLYVDPTTGIAHHAPWDFNHALGQTWQTERQASATNYDFFWTNNLFNRLVADPVHGPRMEARMREQLAGPFSASAIQGRIDGWIDRIEPSAERDWRKWQDSYRGYGGWSWRTDWTSHDEEVEYLRTWVDERAGYMGEWYP